jgi:tetratricopeptide (TPR) repeat protein
VKIGVAEALAGKENAAVAVWEQALAAEPNHELALHMLTLFHLQEKHSQRTLEYAKRLLDVNPHVAEHHWLYAAMLSKAGRRREAIAAAEKAIALDPTASYIRSWLAKAYLEEGEPEKSLEQQDLVNRIRQ